MAISPGTRLGPYEITGSIGAGGMGEVYRARDTKLGREVAIKTLPGALAHDADRLARFEREAMLLAALNHAYIAAVYGLDEHDDTRFIAMELVEGQTLEKKLEGGPLPTEEALEIARQIAEALEAAHEKGVVHRDLKPANVMLTAAGVVKVLDFGLAKAFSGDPTEASPAHSPALSLAMSQAGLILGTAAYMSPEQASGQASDQRADIWAFGVVVFEMLSGLPLFGGESVPHILADVLRAEPDWSRLPKELHPRLRLMLERCLEKKPRKRYHSIADARIDIEAVLADPKGAAAASASGVAAAAPPARSLAWIAATAVIAALAGAAIHALIVRSANAPEPLATRFAVDLEGRIAGFESLALAPDGRRIVYVANGQLYSRRMDQEAATPIPGTNDATNPFFSPDGQSIAFFTTAQQLKAVGFGGEAPRVLADLAQANGIVGDWDAQGRIIFGQFSSYPLSWVPDVGGAPQLFAELGDYLDVDYPDVLPGGEWVLFTGSVTTGEWSGADIVAQNVATQERKVVLERGYFARYVAPGRIVFVRNGVLHAAPFDAERVEVTGPIVPIVQGIGTNETSGHARYAVANGTLIYAPSGGDGTATPIVHVDLAGNATAVSTELRDYWRPRVSPDGSRLAVEVVDEVSGARHIWTMSLATGSATQLTFEGRTNGYPVWARDGREILYVTLSDDGNAIYRKAADGSGDAVLVVEGSSELLPSDVVSGNTLVYHDRGTAGRRDIFTLALDGGAGPEAFLATAADERSARVAPNGEWILYVSDQSGQDRVYLRPYPATPGGQRAVSEGVGRSPTWAPLADAVHFLGETPPIMYSARVDLESSTFVLGRPAPLFDFSGALKFGGVSAAPTYDVLPNGEGFVAVLLPGSTLPDLGGAAAGAQAPGAGPQVNVVLNWITELNRLVPGP